MRLLSWLGSPGPSRRANPVRPRGRRPAGAPLALEPLEGRDVPAFAVPVGYDTGLSPQAAVSGYFDADGFLDLAVANYGDSTVSVLLGNGDGTFDPAPATPATGFLPLSVAVGDFNHDGLLDLATANTYDVSVLLGNGDGTFQAPASVGVFGYPASVAVGDFDGDGLLDLGVMSNYNDYWYGAYGTASVLLGDGLGGFSAAADVYLGGGYRTSAAAADLNGDGTDDLVALNADYGTVGVLLGGAGGYLQYVNELWAGAYYGAVAVGDINSDGAADVVTANGYSDSGVGVRLGDGVGGFGGAQIYAAGGYPTAVALGDFTGDGKTDIAAANRDTGNVSVLYGSGAGAFSAPANYAAGTTPYGIVAGHFDGNGRLDAATVGTGDNQVFVLLNDGTWPAPPPPTVSVGDVTVTEGNGGTASPTGATFTVTLSAVSLADVTVHYATVDGTATAGDYAAAFGNLTIPAGQLSRTFTVAVTGDRLAETTETFAVNLSAPVGATIGDGQGVGTIIDDEPRVSVNDVTVTEGNTGSVTVTFTVTLSAVSDVAVTVHYATANGTATAGDFTAAAGDVTIPAGQLSRTFTVAVTGDRIAEATETFVVNLSAPVNAGVADGQGVGTILDNEPRLSINNVSKKEGNGGTVQFVFTVTLSAAYDQIVTVNYATANGTATAGSDYQAKSGTLTFAPGVTSMTITVNVLADKTREVDETFFVNLSGASSNAFIGVAQGTGLILDDDLPPGKHK